MRQLLAVAAFIGLMLSLAVHVAALLGVDASGKFPFVGWLHGGIFAVFVPFVLVSRKDLGPSPSFAVLRSTFPDWVVFVGAALMVYVVANFLLFTSAAQGGNVHWEEGKYLLKNHGRIIREITPAEYASFKARELRGFSGHWLLFYYVPFVYFGFRRRG